MCEVWRSCLEPLGREGASCAAGVGGEGSHVGSNNLPRLMVAPAPAAEAAATMATMAALSVKAPLCPWLPAEPRSVRNVLPCRTNHKKISLHIRYSKLYIQESIP